MIFVEKSDTTTFVGGADPRRATTVGGSNQYASDGACGDAVPTGSPTIVISDHPQLNR